MADEIQTAYIRFSANLALALQQTEAKLAGYALQQAAAGKYQEIETLVQPRRPSRKTGLDVPVDYGKSNFVRRGVHKPAIAFFAELIDKDRDLVSLVDIQGGIVQSAAATIQRARDEAFLQGFYGVNYTGENGLSTASFDSNNIVAVGVGAQTDTGMNVDKLRAARKILAANHVDLDREQCMMALTAEQVNDLQGEIMVTSIDFNAQNAPVMRDGKLVRLFGFDFVECQIGDAASFGDDIVAMTLSGGHRAVPFWARSGMAVATWADMESRIDVLPQLHYARQVYASICVAATRTDEKKCGQILCKEPA